MRNSGRCPFKDVDHLIRTKLYQQLTIKVHILIGNTAIIDQDIMHQLKDAVQAYVITYQRVNLTRVPDIIQAMEESIELDILVVARGGGDNIQVFNSVELAGRAIGLRPALITAIGHAADEPLLQRVADKHFITPTALGQYFYEMYIKTVEELNNSKAKMIVNLTKQIELNFQTRIQMLSDQTASTLKLMDQNTIEFHRREREMEERLAKAKKLTTIVVVLLTVTIVAIGVYFALRK
jgi:exodeoxyribonuclease VII large subunit